MCRRTHALAGFAVALSLAGCGAGTKNAEPAPKSATPLRITQFYAESTTLHAGGGAVNLCYGVEGAKTLTLNPPVASVWPAMSRCIPVQPTVTTAYTLTAEDGAGGKAVQTVEIRVGPPAAKILEVSVNSLNVAAGEPFPFCVRAENVKSWRLSAGKWKTEPGPKGGCAVDHPKVTTTYTITAVGAMGETDTERVTAAVK